MPCVPSPTTVPTERPANNQLVTRDEHVREVAALPACRLRIADADDAGLRGGLVQRRRELLVFFPCSTVWRDMGERELPRRLAHLGVLLTLEQVRHRRASIRPG